MEAAKKCDNCYSWNYEYAEQRDTEKLFKVFYLTRRRPYEYQMLAEKRQESSQEVTMTSWK